MFFCSPECSGWSQRLQVGEPERALGVGVVLGRADPALGLVVPFEGRHEEQTVAHRDRARILRAHVQARGDRARRRVDHRI